MRTILALTALLGAMLIANSPAQDTNPSSSTQSSANPSTPQPQQPASMQPGTTPPTEPQGTSPSQTPPAQSPSAARPGQAQSGPMKPAPGSVIPVQLTKSVDAKKAKTGDEVVATVTQDMKTQTGEVIVPKDTQVIGHVTEAQAREKNQKESEVGIAFDRAVVKGDPVPLPMSIQAVIGPQDNTANNSGGDQNGPAMAGGAPSPSAPSSPMGSGRGGATTSNPSPQQPNLPAGGADTQTQSKSRPAINGTTEGVIGISNLKLETPAQNSAQGSVLSSEKNNVKIDKGTMMLLRVNP